ncbi:MAG: phage tail tape measure protein [Lachnospiraceae bacterium]|nr:phage tail tape measure protein [Lachnospiraceae bacterium]
MAYDGTLKFDTSIDAKGFQKGIDTIGGIAAKGIKATTGIMAGAATAIGAIGAASIKVGSDFEAAMSKVKAISGTVADQDLPGIIEKAKEMGLSFAEGTDATETAMNILSAKAKEMGASTKFSATESAEALNYMAMAGWKTADMLDGIEGIMNLAAASGEDLAATSDIVTDALTAFGMKAGDATHFADVLAQASSNANTNVGMMGETFKYVAPLAGALKYSAEDTAIAIGLMANASIKGSQAGTSLRSILTRLAKPTKESAAAMEALGLSITDSSGQMKPFSGVITDMRSAFAGLTEEEQASYAAMLGGQEAMSGLLAIVNASEEDFYKLQNSIYNCDGAAAQMAETMNDNLQGQLTILKSKLETVGIALYENMQEPLKDVVAEANGMVEQLQQAFNEGGLEGMVTASGEVLSQVVERIAGAAPELIRAATDLVGSFCDSLKNNAGIGEAAAGLITSLVTGFFSCADDIWTTAIVLVGKMAQGIADGAPEMVQAAGECIGNIADAAIEWAPTILDAGAQIAGALIEGIISNIPQILDTGIDILNNLAQGIRDRLPDLIPVAMEALKNFSGTLRENAGELVDAGLNLIMALAESLIDNLPVFIEAIPTIVTNIAGIINDNAPKLIACGIELIAKLILGLIQSIPTIIANIPSIIQAIVEVFTAFNWINLGSSIIKWITEGVKNLAKVLPQAMKSIGQTARDWLKAIDWRTLGADIINLIHNGIKSLLHAIPNALSSIGSSAARFFKNIDWADLGVCLINGIIAGITGALNGLWRTVSSLCSNLLGYIKGFFGINSPSRVMEDEVGEWLPPGIGKGIEKAMPDLVSQAEDEMGMLADKMQAAVALETGTIELKKNTEQTYKAEMEKGQAFETSPVEVNIEGDIHTHVDLDGKEIGDTTTPIVDKNMGRIDAHKKRGG